MFPSIRVLSHNVGETGDGRYKIYMLHHISLMEKRKKKTLLHTMLGLPLAQYVY